VKPRATAKTIPLGSNAMAGLPTIDTAPWQLGLRRSQSLIESSLPAKNVSSEGDISNATTLGIKKKKKTKLSVLRIKCPYIGIETFSASLLFLVSSEVSNVFVVVQRQVS
jgi:hypothetical protein